MTKTQQYREYQSFCSMHVNPPSFEEWIKQQEEEEPYYREEEPYSNTTGDGGALAMDLFDDR